MLHCVLQHVCRRCICEGKLLPQLISYFGLFFPFTRDSARAHVHMHSSPLGETSTLLHASIHARRHRPIIQPPPPPPPPPPPQPPPPPLPPPPLLLMSAAAPLNDSEGRAASCCLGKIKFRNTAEGSRHSGTLLLLRYLFPLYVFGSLSLVGQTDLRPSDGPTRSRFTDRRESGGPRIQTTTRLRSAGDHSVRTHLFLMAVLR